LWDEILANPGLGLVQEAKSQDEPNSSPHKAGPALSLR
jgi:hypothetical protein